MSFSFLSLQDLRNQRSEVTVELRRVSSMYHVTSRGVSIIHTQYTHVLNNLGSILLHCDDFIGGHYLESTMQHPQPPIHLPCDFGHILTLTACLNLSQLSPLCLQTFINLFPGASLRLDLIIFLLHWWGSLVSAWARSGVCISLSHVHHF